jgi:flagellin-like protein
MNSGVYVMKIIRGNDKDKGVSEVLGSLLVLAITVTLFSSVFYYVATIPAPNNQIYAQFNAKLNIVPATIGGVPSSAANVTIYNIGGEPLQEWNTMFIVLINNTPYRYYLSDPSIAHQISNGPFSAGTRFYYNSSWDNAYANTTTNISLYLYNTALHQVVWSEVLQGYPTQGPILVGFLTSPSPAQAGSNNTFNAIIINTQNSAILSKYTVKLDLHSLLDKKWIANMQYTGNNLFVNSSLIPTSVKSGSYPVYVNISYLSKTYSNLQILSVGSNNTIQKLMITSVTASSYDPSHGSNDNLYISIYSTSYKTESFSLLFIDNYKKYTMNTTANISFGNTGNRYTISSYESLSISVTWNNIGGTSAASGLHKLAIEAVNVNPYVQNTSYSLNITVLPKILLVNDDNAPAGSSQDVLNYYQTMFSYTGYQVDTETISPTQIPTVSGYDLVVWFTGYSTLGVTQIQAGVINSLYNSGVSLLLISGSSSTYNNNNLGLGISASPIGSNSTLNATASKIQNININQAANITSTPYVTSIFDLYDTGWVPFLNSTTSSSISYPIGIFQNHTQTNNKIIVLGFEFSRLYVYQQDYIMNKMMLWLANITIKSGVDLALSDILISNYSPLFMQNVNISIVVSNYSPTPLTSVPLEILMDNEPLNNIPLVYIASIAGDGAYYIYNTTWQATTPGTHTVTAIVNPYHTITEVNYANNEQAAIIKNAIDVKFSTLVIWAHTSTTDKNISAVTNALNSTDMKYKFINYYESSGPAPAKNLPQIIVGYNLVIIDFNNTGTLSSGNNLNTTSLSTAIHKFLVNANATKYPYSMLFLGENAVNAINENSTIETGLLISLNPPQQLQTVNQPVNISGIDYNGPGFGLGFFGTNVTRGYGLEYKFSSSDTIPITSSDPASMAILSTSNSAPFNIPPKTGLAILEDVSGVMVGIVPLNYNNIVGLIQNHTQNTQYSPLSSSSSLLSSSTPSPSIYTQNFFMLNLALSFRYVLNSPMPEILASDINISSSNVMLNNYYIINGMIRNLGNKGISVVLQSYEENSLFNTQTIYLPPQNVTQFQVLWDPLYASSPTSQYLRFIIINTNVIKLPTQEAIISKQVYYYIDNGSSLTGWNHYDVLAYLSGENIFGLTGNNPPATNIIYGQSYWTTSSSSLPVSYGSYNNRQYSAGYSAGSYSGSVGWSDKHSYSYPYSYYIQDIIDTESIPGQAAYVYLPLPSESVPAGENLILSWYWMYSIAFAQNGLFLMVDVTGQSNPGWYQVELPYNNNPDLGNLITLTDPNNSQYTAIIYEAYNGISGGGTFTWTYHAISTNALYVMNPGTGLPESTPLPIQGDTVQFFFYYIAPAIYASESSGSNQAGAGIYLDNVMLAISGGLDGWKVISPGESATQYGISQSGIQYLAYQNGAGGAPTHYLIADYTNSEYPTFKDSMWDNAISPPIDIVNAQTATISFTFKANIAQGWYGDGWPPDYFEVSVSTDAGASWSFLYTPPTYPTPEQGAGGGTICDVSGYQPANGANNTYWLTVTINLNSFVGQTIILDFQIITNNGASYSYGSYFEPWHAVDESVTANPFLGFYMTNIDVMGYSAFSPIMVSSVWT